MGGRFRVVMHGDRDYVHRGEYLRIEPGRRLEFTWVSDFLPPELSRTRVRVTFEPAGPGRTRLRLEHEELPPGDAYAGHEAGWASVLAKLADHLAEEDPS